MIVEVLTASLRFGADHERFIDLDQRLQQGAVYQQRGIVRRTAGFDADDGTRVGVTTFWASAAQAVAANEAVALTPQWAEWLSCIDEATIRVSRFQSF